MASFPSARSLPSQRRRAFAIDLLKNALRAVDPKEAVLRWIRLVGDQLHVADRVYDLSRYRRIFVVGCGKATAPMVQAMEEILDGRISAGVVNVKYGFGAPTRIVEINEAGHPIPDERSVAGAQKMAALMEAAGEDDLVICLISGGGSALMVLPPSGITLADKRKITDALLRSGANINEMNTVRKHLSRIKGGGLARLAYPAQVISLMLSDVVGSPLDIIASGPTVPDSSTFADAYAILERYALLGKAPAPVISHLRAGLAGSMPETPKEGDPIFEHTQNVIVGSNEIAARCVADQAKAAGMNTLLLSTYVEGEAREVAQVFAGIAKEIVHSGNPIPRPACVVAGGETTVVVRGFGTGGRNQELALAAAIRIEGLDDTMIIGCATDGNDGPTDAAGAIATGDTVRRAHERGLDPRKYLADNDSYHFFKELDDLIITGPTNTNVVDLTLVLVF
ncbi:MAG: glycerate kinase [Bacteroidetes bacterium]|nr:glycerate kinase [Bacteroidota bacterium]MCL5026350.1 glycerate kinase [Chloroflexota bacterium]